MNKNTNEEQTFAHGESGREVVRIGDNVHKTLGDNYEISHRVLKCLEDHRFLYSPRIKGVDDKGREIMTYVDGTPIEADPIPLGVSIQAIKILREFHDILSTFEGVSGGQTICHLDYAPWNVLQNNGQIVGIIDFDDLHIGQRIDDLSYAIWTFLDLGDDNQHLTTDRQIEHIIELISAYGADIDLTGFIESLIQNQQRVLKMREEAVSKAVENSDREYQSGKVKLIRNSIDWARRNKKEITQRIKELG